MKHRSLSIIVSVTAAMVAFPAFAQDADRPAAKVQSSALKEVSALAGGAAFRVGRARLAADYERTVKELIQITETPAPPFKEEVRARLFADMLRSNGLKEVAIDAEGNVTALRPGTATGPGADKVLVVSAHLDTVFPEGTPIKVRREGDRLFAPGIVDDSLGLASILAWVRALASANIATRAPILFVGTVGEEGRGDLRGVRHLMTKGPYKDRIAAFVSVDGSNVRRVVHSAVGSRRYRVTFSGPGGHSFGAFGTVNPMVPLADTISGLYRIQVPADPKTTYSASVIGGGTSVNTIPSSAFVDIDMRSRDSAALADLEKKLMSIIAASVAAENRSRSTSNGSIAADAKLIGDRPAGSTDAGHPLVQAALASAKAFGFEPYLDSSSTDSNIPMSLGIPAVTIGSGAGGGRTHTVEEYLEVPRERFIAGLTAGLSTIVSAANGVVPPANPPLGRSRPTDRK